MRERRSTNDFVGKIFGRLRVVGLSRVGKYGKYWECICECGNTSIVPTSNLGRKGRPTTSCGCYGQNVSRKYSINEEFFSDINSEESAYWLGFIYADGNIKQGCRAFQIALQNRDVGHLEKMLNSFQSNHPIFCHSNISMGVMIKNKRFVENLVNAGIYPNKSYTIHPIVVREDLQRHFWRGVIDGDGTLSSKKGKQVLGISGNYHTCEGFRIFLVDNGVETSAITRSPVGKVSTFSVNGRNMAKIASGILYGSCSFFLDRKMEIANQLGGV